MKKCVIWLILLQLCCSEYADYDDYHPRTIPLQAENPSSDYKAVMRNLCDNWQSPISYLKKRGYMPSNIDYEPKINFKKKTYDQNEKLPQGENYFFFPDNKQQRLRNSMEEDFGKSNAEELEEPTVTELSPAIKASNNDTADGIIKKVKDKFLSIFSHKDKNKSDQLDGTFDQEDPEFLENYEDNEVSDDRRIFQRSVSDKPLKILNSSSDGILSNLTDTEIHFIKSFINWFKQNKEDFKFLSPLNFNTTSGKNTDSKESDANKKAPRPEESRPSQSKSNVQNTTEGVLDKNIMSSTNPTNAIDECKDVDSRTSTTSKTIQGHNNTSAGKSNSSTTEGKDADAGDLTVDLDINQKNGTGEEIYPTPKCACLQTTSTTPQYPCSDKNKYITKSKFLAHLHHMVDEVGKPPHKPLDLAKVQDIIDNSKKLPTVTMGGANTTQCAPLRLNDMSFDLEWNKIDSATRNSREKMNLLDIPYAYQPQGQSMASKFLQEVNSYPGKSEEYLKTPYADNFLDSQQSLPSDLELPLKSSTKREAGVVPSFGKNMDISSLPDSEISYDFDSDDDIEENPKRRIKGRIKGRGRGRGRKKPKHKHNTPSESISINEDLEGLKDSNDFDSFDELKDIQFRVNDNDEQAISTFISNLNSPPEVFSFDVDQYLRSAKETMEPKAPEFEYQSPETRTYYEFLESPAVENERLPLIEPPSETQIDPIVDKRSRQSPEKRDLLRQYIKGVSNALNHNFEDFCEDCNKAPEDKLQRSPNLDTDISFRTNNLIDGFSTNLDAMDSIKSKGNDEALNNYFLLNSGDAQAFEELKQNPEVIPNDYSPQSLEIDLDLDKKFRDLNIGGYRNGLPRSSASVDANAKDNEESQDDNSEVQKSNLESTNNDIY